MSASEVLAEIQRRGGSLHLDGDGFEYRGPAGSLSPDLRALLVKHKPELLAHLRQQDAHQHPVNAADDLHQRIRQAQDWRELETALERAQAAFEQGELSADQVEALATLAAQEGQAMPENAEDLRLSHLFDEQPARRAYSRILGEAVVFAADGVEVPAHLEGVVYRASELRQLVGCSPERLRAVHMAKRHFDGELIDATEARTYEPATPRP